MIKQKIGNVWCVVERVEDFVFVRMYKWGFADSAIRLRSYNNVAYEVSRDGDGKVLVDRRGTLEQGIADWVDDYKTHHATL